MPNLATVNREKAMPSSSVHSIAVIDLGDFSCPRVTQAGARFAARKLGGQSLINRMARRLSECAQVDRVYVVGAQIPATILTAGLAGVKCIDLPMSHVCERLCEAADASGAEWVVYVPANRPFVDPTLIDQMLSKATRMSSCDYVGYTAGDGDVRAIEHLGLTGEACHADTLRRLRRNVDRLNDQQAGSIASWLVSAPGAYHLKFIPVPKALNRNDLRFAIEDEQDWDDAELLCDTVGDEDSQWQELTQLVIANAGLRDSMADRNT